MMWLKYYSLAIMPSVIATFAALIWALFGPLLQVPNSDVEVFNSVFGIVGLAHGLIASMQINRGYNQQQKIQIALFLKDERMFKENACIRINPAIMFLLFIFSLIFFLLFLFFPFESIKTGIVAVWAVVFVLYFLWKVAQELFNPYKGVHKVSQDEVQEKFGIEVLKETLENFRR